MPQVFFRFYAELNELLPAEIRQVTFAHPFKGRRATLSIPVAAQGADQLFDAFAALPGMDLARLSGALDRAPTGGPAILWRRASGPRLPGPRDPHQA